LDEKFRQAIAKNLNSGSFRLLIAVDRINPELERAILYSNRLGASIGQGLQAIELSLYGQGELEFLVPVLHGQIASDPTGGSPPDPPLSALLELAKERGILEFAEICLGAPGDWEITTSAKFGGSLRFFREKQKRDLLFGLSISGERLSPPALKGQLDVWIRTATLAQNAGLSEDNVRRTLQTGHPFFKEVEKDKVYVIRLQSREQAQNLIEQLKAWTMPSEPRASAGMPEVGALS
jgi:hypothetical protein